MGLDMYAYVCFFTTPSSPTPDALPEDAQRMHYWRKHPDLHGWMEDLFRAKGGKGEFNCMPVVLTAEDLDALEDAVRQRSLPETGGFFFGASDASRTEDDLLFIRKARHALSLGATVLYDSWW